MKMFQRKDEGFTLVELMVVVHIIGILVAIAIPVFNAAKENAQEKACWGNERTVEGAYQTFMAGSSSGTTSAVSALPDTSTYANVVTALVAADALANDPSCPTGGTYSFLSSSTSNGSLLSFVVDCSDHGNHP